MLASLATFSLCEINVIPVPIIPNQIYSLGAEPNKQSVIRVADPDKAPIRDPSETYLVSAMVPNPSIEATAPAIGEITNNPAQPGAIPFPPRNPENIGKMCPSSTARAVITTKVCESEEVFVNIIARTDLAMSRSSTVTAAGILIVRSTLVPPVLPLPCSLMSIPFRIRPIISPKGIEPSRYANEIRIRYSMSIHPYF